MTGPMAPKVPFTTENVKKCICTKCPVQTESKCAKDKMMAMGKGMGMGMPLMAAAVPGMYCSTGKATCTDLDWSKMCMCMSCPIWEEYSLAKGMPMGYFCRDGQAK